VLAFDEIMVTLVTISGLTINAFYVTQITQRSIFELWLVSERDKKSKD